MKYTDEQRVEKINSTTVKLLIYLNENAITPNDFLSQEPLRWAITTPLFNIGEHQWCVQGSGVPECGYFHPCVQEV